MPSDKIKVLQICAVGFTVEKLLLPLIDEMSVDYDVTTAFGKDEASERLRKRGYKIENIYIGRRIHPVDNFKTIIKLYRYMKKEKFSIVHVHTPVAGILGRIAAKIARVPVVVYTAHGFYFHDNMSFIKKSIYVIFEKIGGWFSDFIFTQSTEDYHTAIKHRIIGKSRVMVIGNGVDVDKFNRHRISIEKKAELKKKFDIDDKDVTVGIIGRVVREKGYFEWIQAAKEIIENYKNVKFLAVGDTLESDWDGIKAELDKVLSEYKLNDKVIFTGSRSDIPELLSIMDVFTLPSYREGMPRSIIEAMCMSVPVVATDIRGCREEVVEGETGFLIPVKDYKALAQKIVFLLEHPEERKKMGENARHKAETEFNEKLVLSKQLEVLKELLDNKKII